MYSYSCSIVYGGGGGGGGVNCTRFFRGWDDEMSKRGRKGKRR